MVCCQCLMRELETHGSSAARQCIHWTGQCTVVERVEARPDSTQNGAPPPQPDLTAPHQFAMVPRAYLQHRTVPCPGLNWSGLDTGVVRGVSLEGGVVNRSRRAHSS